MKKTEKRSQEEYDQDVKKIVDKNQEAMEQLFVYLTEDIKDVMSKPMLKTAIIVNMSHFIPKHAAKTFVESLEWKRGD